MIVSMIAALVAVFMQLGGSVPLVIPTNPATTTINDNSNTPITTPAETNTTATSSRRSRGPGLSSQTIGYTFALSSDGRYLAKPALDKKSIGVWEIKSGRCLWQRKKSGVRAVAFSPDGKRLAYSVRDKQDAIIVTSTTTGSYRKYRVGRVDYTVRRLSWAPDGKSIAAIGYSWVTILNPSSGRETGRFKGEEMDQVVWLPGCATMATIHYRNEDVLFWHILSGEITGRLERTKGSFANGIALSPDGKRLAVSASEVGNQNHVFEMWDLAERKCVDTIKVDGQVMEMAWSPTNDMVAFATRGQMNFYRPASPGVVGFNRIPVHPYNLAWTADGSLWRQSEDMLLEQFRGDRPELVDVYGRPRNPRSAVPTSD